MTLLKRGHVYYPYCTSNEVSCYPFPKVAMCYEYINPKKGTGAIPITKVARCYPYHKGDRCFPYHKGNMCYPHHKGDRCYPYHKGDRCYPYHQTGSGAIPITKGDRCKTRSGKMPFRKGADAINNTIGDR